ncbi:MAG: 5,6-dimethylbenzimidazole synthase [Syntrophorhabdaceae bacterium PtaU1.Bin034]|jgi:nitroreductase|nr:MAG: 5,6-dimethylbenzimidazole synthase [Syntrophorhabdaceae bacterium PtaU1.Bin034]
MELIEAIKERRSIRKYKSDAVADEVILQCIEAARLAPSWANTQVSRFVVVKDQKVKEALADTLTSNNPARQAILEAPCTICLVAQRGISGLKKGEPVTDKGDWFMFDAGIAMEHLVLAAWSLGLGTVHVGAFDAAKAEGVLGVAGGYSIVAMTPLGYFERTPAPTPRKPLEDLVYLDRFGKAFRV